MARVGALREQLLFQSPSYTTTAQGSRVATYRTVLTAAAEPLPQAASERLQVDAMQSERRARFRLQAVFGLDANMRVLWTPSWPEGAARRVFEMAGPPTMESRQWMVVDLVERAA